MNMIQYQQATYASNLRDRLEQAGCDTRIAGIVARAVGELIDHVAHAQDDMRREMQMKGLDASVRTRDQGAARRESFDRTVGIALLVMTAAVTGGVLIALFG